MDKEVLHEQHPADAQESDPASGVSDDPRVDPTPDHHHSDTDTDAGTDGAQ